MRSVTVSGRRYRLDESKVERALAGELPEPIRDHFVVIDGRRWPPKQVLSRVTGLDRADFTTHQARSILKRLGFPAGRRSQTSARRLARSPTSEASTTGGSSSVGTGRPVADLSGEQSSLAEALRPFVGQWVALRGTEVLVTAPTPKQVVAWLTEHGQQAQSVFRVPDSDGAIGGAAPL
jgi:hypothetical protein